MRVLVASAAIIALFLAAFTVAHQSVIGSPVIPCDDAGLLLYCMTAKVVGTGAAWLLWHGFACLGIGWCFLKLSEQ